MKGQQNIVRSNLGADVRIVLADGKAVTVGGNATHDCVTAFADGDYALLSANDSFKAHVLAGHFVVSANGGCVHGGTKAEATDTVRTKAQSKAEPDTAEKGGTDAKDDGKSSSDAEFWAQAEAAAKGEGTRRRGGRGASRS